MVVCGVGATAMPSAKHAETKREEDSEHAETLVQVSSEQVQRKDMVQQGTVAADKNIPAPDVVVDSPVVDKETDDLLLPDQAASATATVANAHQNARFRVRFV